MSRRKTILVLIIALAVIGVAWLVGRGPACRFMSAHLGDRMLRMADGKFTNPERFVAGRLDEAAFLAAAACFLSLACIASICAINKKIPLRWHWVSGACIGFLGINLFAALAAHTALFWCALFSGRGTSHNYIQYQIKRALMAESDAPAQAVLIGNSQTQAEIDERILNDRLGKRLWTTELHFPGSRPYEMALAYLKLPNVNLKFAICYLSETYFYNGLDSPGLMYFQTWRDLPEYYRLGGGQFSWTQSICYGLLGDIVPLFRLREPIVSRLLGFQLIDLNQERYNNALETNLAERAAFSAKGYHADAAAEFHKKSLLRLADACRARGCRLMLCMGQMNPILGRALDPAIRPDMVAFLRQMAKHDPNVVLIDESMLPIQTPEDYKDLTHANDAAQTRFSEHLADILDNLMGANNRTKAALESPAQ